ncbi:hypothetical protein WA026_017742, partial [Henosepilachna vigintioctopunctata]
PGAVVEKTTCTCRRKGYARLREDEEDSESQQSNCSDPAEDDFPLQEINSCLIAIKRHIS